MKLKNSIPAPKSTPIPENSHISARKKSRITPVMLAKSPETTSSSKVSTPVHKSAVLRAGFLAIGVNLLLFAFKLIISIVSGSLAVLSDALHGLVDTLSGIIVVISEKIQPHTLKSGKKFTHADIERLGSQIIGLIILLVALHIIIEAISGLFHPEELNISIPTIIILIISIATKIALGLYLRKTSQKVGSATLKASSVETLNDSIISAAVLISTLIYFIWHINLESYISLAVAAIILKTAIDLLRPHKSHQNHHSESNHQNPQKQH